MYSNNYVSFKLVLDQDNFGFVYWANKNSDVINNCYTNRVDNLVYFNKPFVAILINDNSYFTCFFSEGFFKSCFVYSAFFSFYVKASIIINSINYYLLEFSINIYGHFFVFQNSFIYFTFTCVNNSNHIITHFNIIDCLFVHYLLKNNHLQNFLHSHHFNHVSLNFLFISDLYLSLIKRSEFAVYQWYY